MMSYHYAGLREDAATLLALNQSALLSLYASTDIGIHYDGWSACRYDKILERLRGSAIRTPLQRFTAISYQNRQIISVIMWVICSFWN